MYDQVATAEITLVNLGKVGFEFTGMGMDPAQAKKPKPGVPIMVPHTVSFRTFFSFLNYVHLYAHKILRYNKLG